MKYIKSLGLFFIILLTLNILISIFNYFEIINLNITKIFMIISMLLSGLISGIYLGLNSNNKGYLEGIKLSLIILIIFTFFNLILRNFNCITIIYYIIIILIISIGSMIGINTKKSK